MSLYTQYMDKLIQMITIEHLVKLSGNETIDKDNNNDLNNLFNHNNHLINKTELDEKLNNLNTNVIYQQNIEFNKVYERLSNIDYKLNSINDNINELLKNQETIKSLISQSLSSVCNKEEIINHNTITCKSLQHLEEQLMKIIGNSIEDDEEHIKLNIEEKNKEKQVYIKEEQNIHKTLLSSNEQMLNQCDSLDRCTLNNKKYCFESTEVEEVFLKEKEVVIDVEQSVEQECRTRRKNKN
jgi:hypothetical protein